MYTQKLRIAVSIFVISFIFQFFGSCNAMTRKQLKNSGKLMKNSCMPKNDVTEEEVGKIEEGKFVETRNVMCYVACIYSMAQTVKNNKLNYDAIIKQVDLMFPPETKVGAKAAAAHCKDIYTKQYNDLCESAYWTARCLYDFDPVNFIFP